MGRVLAALIGVLFVASCGGDDDSGGESFQATSTGLSVRPDELAPAPDGKLWILVGDKAGAVDPAKRRLAATPRAVDTGSGSKLLYDLAAGDEGVWAIGKDGSWAIVVPADTATARTGTPSRVDFNPLGLRAGDTFKIAVGEGRVWAIQTSEAGVSIVDPKTGDETSANTNSSQDLVVGGGYGWVVSEDDEFNSSSGQLVRVDPRTGDAKRIELDDDPTAVAFADGQVWILFEDYVTRYDMAGREGPTMELGDLDASAGDIAVGRDTVWVVAADSRRAVAIDRKSLKPKGDPITLPAGEPGDLVVAGEDAWLALKDKPPIRIAPTG